MYKQIIIIFVVIVVIIIANIITQNNTNSAVEAMSKNLSELREKIYKLNESEESSKINEEQNSKSDEKQNENQNEDSKTDESKKESLDVNKEQEESTKKMEDIENLWEEKDETMSYYIEHNELEKVKTELTKLKANIETKDYQTAVESLDNCAFILKHIKEKSALKIVNIF